MARKRAATVEQARNDIKRQYKRGRKRERTVTTEAKLTDVEREVKKQMACFLKAQDFSYSYIADALGLGVDVIKKWFANDVEVDGMTMNAKVAEILDDMVRGGLKYLKTYTIELVEMLVEIARYTQDERLAKDCIVEALGMVGITKVNKSESAAKVTERHEVDIRDKTGLLEGLKDAPPEVRQRAAELAADLATVGEEWRPA